MTPSSQGLTPGPQMVFDFPTRPALGREDFLVAPCNAAAVAWVDRWPDWPGAALALVGPPGSGKTHLAHVLSARAGARVLPLTDGAVLSAVVDGDGTVPLVLEMAPELSALSPETERALFHALNLTRERGGTLLLTASTAPSRWPVALADLRSRLSVLPVAEIAPPDESLLEMLLVKLFADRQVIVSPDVPRYLSRRIERSFAAAGRVVAVLDAMAWTGRRPITVALAREMLARTDDGASDRG